MCWEVGGWRWYWHQPLQLHGRRPTQCWTFTPSPPPPPLSQGGPQSIYAFFEHTQMVLSFKKIPKLSLAWFPILRTANSPSPSRAPTSLSISRDLSVSTISAVSTRDLPTFANIYRKANKRWARLLLFREKICWYLIDSTWIWGWKLFLHLNRWAGLG